MIGIVSRAQLVGTRYYVWIGVVIIAALVTPPDIVSLLALALPLILLFEITLIAIGLAEKRKAGAEKEDELDQ